VDLVVQVYNRYDKEEDKEADNGVDEEVSSAIL
jgi:hypothetical protein